MSEPPRQAPGLIPRPLAYGLIILIAGLWGFDVLRSIVDQNHQVNTTLGTAFMVVAGLLGGLARGRRDPAEPPPDDPPPDTGPPAPDPPPDDPPPDLPPGAVSAAELIARLLAEREQGPRR